MWQVAAIFSIFAGLYFSPGPNDIFDRAKSWAMKNYANNEGKFWRFLLQIIYCPWCASVWIAIPLAIIFGENYWITLAIGEMTATLTILRSKNG